MWPNSSSTDHGIDVNDPAFASLFGNVNTDNVKYDDVTTFDDLYKNYIDVKGTLIVDCREYPEALTIIYNTYIVPASIFHLHEDIFPANRNYFIYGPVEQCAKVSATSTSNPNVPSHKPSLMSVLTLLSRFNTSLRTTVAPLSPSSLTSAPARTSPRSGRVDSSTSSLLTMRYVFTP